MHFLEKLEERERLFVLGLLGLLCLISILMGVSTLYNLRQELSAEAQKNSEIIRSLRKIKSQISSLGPATTSPGKAQVFTEVNNSLNQYQLKPISINEEKKDTGRGFQLSIRLQGIPISSLLNFLYDVEYKNKIPLSISFLRIRKTVSKDGMYDVNLKLKISGV